jgi:hypothetical protein
MIMTERLTKDEYDRITKIWFINYGEVCHREPADMDLFNKLIRMQAQAVKEDLERADMRGEG